MVLHRVEEFRGYGKATVLCSVTINCVISHTNHNLVQISITHFLQILKSTHAPEGLNRSSQGKGERFFLNR